VENTASLEVEVLLVREERQDRADERADQLRAEVHEHVGDGRFDRGGDRAARPCHRVERHVGGEQADRHGGVEVGAGLERHVDTGEHAEAPAEVDQQPAAVEALRLGQDDVGDHAGTQQDQRRGTEDLGPERVHEQ
jgi:hypothetical protein